jgi:hypothetical protein
MQRIGLPDAEPSADAKLLSTARPNRRDFPTEAYATFADHAAKELEQRH